MTCGITSILSTAPYSPDHLDWEDSQANHDSDLLICLFSLCINWCTEGKGESERTGTGAGHFPTERQTIAKIYIIT